MPARDFDGRRFKAELLDAMAHGFTTAALWADGIPLDMTDNGETGGLEALTPDDVSMAKAHEICARFLEPNADDVEAHMDAFGDPDGGHPGEYVGHTFYLTAAGHGVSFTDRAWRDDDPMTAVCKRLETSARTFGEVEHLMIYANADGETASFDG